MRCHGSKEESYLRSLKGARRTQRRHINSGTFDPLLVKGGHGHLVSVHLTEHYRVNEQ